MIVIANAQILTILFRTEQDSKYLVNVTNT